MPYPECDPERKPAARETLRWLKVHPEHRMLRKIHQTIVDKVGYEFRAKSNEEQFVRPRQISMWLMRRLSGASLPQIGRFYHQHHSTVLYSIKKIERLRKDNADCWADTEYFRLELEREAPAREERASA